VRQVSHLQEFYNIVLNTLSNGIRTVCIKGRRGVEVALKMYDVNLTVSDYLWDKKIEWRINRSTYKK